MRASILNHVVDHPDLGTEALRQVVARDPQVVDAWLMLGYTVNSRCREFSRALDAFQLGTGS